MKWAATHLVQSSGAGLRARRGDESIGRFRGQLHFLGQVRVLVQEGADVVGVLHRVKGDLRGRSSRCAWRRSAARPPARGHIERKRFNRMYGYGRRPVVDHPLKEYVFPAPENHDPEEAEDKGHEPDVAHRSAARSRARVPRAAHPVQVPKRGQPTLTHFNHSTGDRRNTEPRRGYHDTRVVK